MAAKTKFEGKGLVWDPSKNKFLCNLNDGPFITTNDYEIEVMENAGFKGKTSRRNRKQNEEQDEEDAEQEEE